MERRQFLTAAGAAGVMLVGHGDVWAAARRPSLATEPWVAAVQPVADIRLYALSYAILAPNPHNRQPWFMRLVDTDKVDIYCDLSKRLPETDPFDRQITIGFGALLELARMAAAERGYAVAVSAFPDGAPEPRLDHRPVARLLFTENPALQRDPLFAEILRRRSNKEAYDASRKPSDMLLGQVAAEGHWTNNDNILGAGTELMLDALKIEAGTLRTNIESVQLFRIGEKELAANPDGIALTGPKIRVAKLLGMLDKEKLSDPASKASKAALDQMLAAHSSVPAIIWIKTTGNSRMEQLDAGRRYVRANLQASALGLAMHPVSQSLQEYPEMAESFKAIHDLLGASGAERIQMLARVGYAPAVGPAPGWPVERHLTA